MCVVHTHKYTPHCRVLRSTVVAARQNKGERSVASTTDCSSAVLQLAKMIKRPVISIISQQLFNFENGVSMFVHYYPHLVGYRFNDLAYLFPDGIVMGLVDRTTGKARCVPSIITVV